MVDGTGPRSDDWLSARQPPNANGGTGHEAKLREAMDLLRSLKQKYPEDSDELLQQRFRKELERHPAMRRAVIEDIYRGWLQELTGRETH